MYAASHKMDSAGIHLPFTIVIYNVENMKKDVESR